MGFEKILGHNVVIKALTRAIESNKVSNSYIFEGPEGVGKFMVALATANAIAYAADIKVFQTDDKTIKVEEIRRLRMDINIMPYQSERKVYIIRDAEKMTADAQNAFLKVLEEPPYYGVIILTCNSINSLLPTIRSRCIVYHFGSLNKKDVKDVLIDHGISSSKAAYAAALSGGSVSRALMIATSEEFDSIKEIVDKIISHIADKELLKSVEDVEQLQDKQDFINDILTLLQLWYMDLIYAKLEMYDIISHVDKLDRIKSLSRELQMSSLVKSIKLIETTRERINRYINFLSAIEDMVIGLQELR